MAANLAQIEQTAQVSAELANDYMIGGLAQTAGYPEGAELQDDVVRLMSSLGIDIAPVPVETGFILAGTLAAVRAGLSSGAKKGAQARAPCIGPRTPRSLDPIDPDTHRSVYPRTQLRQPTTDAAIPGSILSSRLPTVGPMANRGRPKLVGGRCGEVFKGAASAPSSGEAVTSLANVVLTDEYVVELGPAMDTSRGCGWHGIH